jgi:DNA repair protein RadC
VVRAPSPASRLGRWTDRWSSRSKKRRKELPPAPVQTEGHATPAMRAALDVGALDDTALLAAALGCSPERAARMLEGAGSLVRLARFDIDDLTELAGASRAEAQQIAAASELGRRALVREMRPAGPTLGAAAIARWFRLRMGGLFVQEIWAVGLDDAGAIRGACRVSRADIHGAALDAAEVVRRSAEMRVKTVILVHNHPSGDLAITPDDLRFTLRVHRAALSVGVKLADMILVGPTPGYVSMAEQGVLPGSA